MTDKELDDMASELRATHCSNEGLHDAAADALTALRVEVAALKRVVAAADAMRNKGVNLAQTIVEPGCDGPADPVGDFIELFDGPTQRAYDAARAALNDNPTTDKS